MKETAEQAERFLCLRLTEKARTALGELESEVERANEEILEGLSVEEQVLLRRLLRDLQS